MARNTIATTYVQVRPSMTGVASEVRSHFVPAGTGAGKALGTSLVGALKKTLGVAAIGKVISDSITAGADLQQSLGGVETLFKENADAVIANSQNAYRTAGMSANAYMQNVTNFSASLLQGLGGDTEAAASVADMALSDMADNANKFGSDMERITDAYQGFSRQNYTMLDNLKLGYGGTKSEMQRLLADATKLSGVKYDISNLADVYSAIHVIQEEMGVTGTTSKEAASTISGSMASMKASFNDVMSYLALGMDAKPALNALAETTGTFLVGNLLPAIWNVVSAAPSALVTFLKALIPENAKDLVSTGVAQVSTFISDSLPELFENGTAMIVEMANGWYEGYPELMIVVGNLIVQLLGTLTTAVPKLIESGAALIGHLAEGAISNAPQMIGAGANLLAKLLVFILSHTPQMAESGIKLIGQLVAGIISAIPNVIAAIPQIIEEIKRYFDAYNWEQIGINIIEGIASGIVEAGSAIIEAAKTAALDAYEAAKDALGIASPSKLMRDEVGRYIPEGIAVGISENTGPITTAMRGLAAETKTDYFMQMGYTDAGPASASVRSGDVNVTVHIHAVPGQNVDELVDALMIKIYDEVEKKGAVFS